MNWFYIPNIFPQQSFLPVNSCEGQYFCLIFYSLCSTEESLIPLSIIFLSVSQFSLNKNALNCSNNLNCQNVFKYSLLVLAAFCMCACSIASVLSGSFRPCDCSPPVSSVRGDSPRKNTPVGRHALLQGIFPTQGSSLCLLCLLH